MDSGGISPWVPPWLSLCSEASCLVILKYSGNPPGTRDEGEGNMGSIGMLGSQAVRKSLTLRSNRSLEVG